MADPAALHDALQETISEVLIGNEDVVERLTVAALARGHVLIEGVPGVAKTTIANLFAAATGLEYNRIQMTPDILPADITGTHVYRQNTGDFDLQRGPIFANIVVADEINRATPKTQSALLEAMQENLATIEGETFALPVPFMVVATQNPIEMEGTHELPEAQRDRFMMKLTVDIPEKEEELALLDRFDADPNMGPHQISQVVSQSDIVDAQERADEVHVDRSVKEYLRGLVDATRDHSDIAYGGSSRASLMLLQAAKANAAIHGREYVIPGDVKSLIEPVLGHRIVLDTEAELVDRTPSSILEEIVDTVAPPSSVDAETAIPGSGEGEEHLG